MTFVATKGLDGNRIMDLPEGTTTHFFITVVETHEDDGDTDKIWRGTRCWGYTPTFEEAEEKVLENYTDMHECSYQWAVIEEHVMDAFAIPTGRFQWYHWSDDKETYERCEQPEWAKNVYAWGIG